jgi:hypothetical protein
MRGAWSFHRASASFLLLVVVMLAASAASAQTADSTVIEPGKKTFLEPNFPNPFSNVTVIGYTIDEETQVELKVYDVTYRLVAVLVDNVRQAPQRYEVVFTPAGLPSAMYFYELRTSQGVQQRRMLFIK